MLFIPLQKKQDMSKSRYFYYYRHLICDTLILTRDIHSPMELPYIKGLLCVASSGAGNSTLSTKSALELTTGQRAITRLAKKSIAGFNLREKSVVSCQCTLRRYRLYMFLDLLTTFVMPKWASNSKAEKTNETLPKKSLALAPPLANTISFGMSNFLEFPQLEPFFTHFESVKGCNINIMINPQLIKVTHSSETNLWGF